MTTARVSVYESDPLRTFVRRVIDEYDDYYEVPADLVTACEAAEATHNYSRLLIKCEEDRMTGDGPTTELCGDTHYRDGDDCPLRCNRPVDPQPDGRRHRGEHRYRSEHFGWSWPNRYPKDR